jgi:hypothetical protein
MTRTYEFVTERGGEMVKTIATGKNIRAALKAAGIEWANVVTYKAL